jgi:hypothetical protein
MSKRPIRFPVLTSLMLAGAFVLLAATGGFSYSSGVKIIETPNMQMVSHTEYRYSEPGQIIARLVDFQGAPVSVINCTATILNPNKSPFASNQLMVDTGNITGDHYYTFTTPAGPEGTYEYQATCFYLQGANTRNTTVTNSFHLSSAFTQLLANASANTAALSSIQNNLTFVQANLTALTAQVGAVNTSLAGQITSLSNQLNVNITMLYDQQNLNTTALMNQLNTNITSVLNAITSQNNTVNLTPVLNAIANLDAAMAANFTQTNGLITTLQTNMNNNFTVTTSYLSAINVTSNNAYALLQSVNVTTLNTYNYVTTTLASNINTVLADLGVINATVNRIETNTLQINATANTILENQQNQVVMSVYSG